MTQTLTLESDSSTRQRILAATAEIVSRNGKTKLSLSDVAAEAGVSRPTLYRWFASKEVLLTAFSRYELEEFERGLKSATADLKGVDKLDAALQFIVDYQHSYSGVSLVDIEPEHVIGQFSRFIPQMRKEFQQLLAGPNAAVKAATAVRVAISHYIIRSDDADQFLAQLRDAVGIKVGPHQSNSTAALR
jgi:AcrR family transcriptional regulator